MTQQVILIKKWIKLTSIRGTDRQKKRANKLADIVIAYEKSQIGLDRLLNYFYQLK